MQGREKGSKIWKRGIEKKQQNGKGEIKRKTNDSTGQENDEWKTYLVLWKKHRGMETPEYEDETSPSPPGPIRRNKKQWQAENIKPMIKPLLELPKYKKKLSNLGTHL